MNKLITKRIGVLLISILFISSLSRAQFKDIDFLKSSPADGVKYLQAYFAPWINAFGAGLNGSWYNTAKPHKFGGFDITGGINVGVVPSSATTFDLSTIGLSSSLTGTGIAPTIAGPKTAGPLLSYKVNGVTLASFNAPKGTDWKYIPVPTAQVGIGLPFGTEIKLRYLPKITFEKGNISAWGVGLMHSIMQYIPGNKLIPADVSLFGGYTKLTGNVPLGLNPDPTMSGYAPTYLATNPFSTQNLNVKVTALNVGVIASLNLPVITFYGGIGYGKTQTDVLLSGNFPLPVLVTPTLPAVPYAQYNETGVKKGSDFPSINIKNFSGLRANIGFRIKLAVITIHADYTKALYNVFSTGIGISFR